MNIDDVDTFWIERGFKTNNLWHQGACPIFTYQIRRECEGHAISVKDDSGSMRGDDFANEIHQHLLSWARHRGFLGVT